MHIANDETKKDRSNLKSGNEDTFDKSNVAATTESPAGPSSSKYSLPT